MIICLDYNVLSTVTTIVAIDHIHTHFIIYWRAVPMENGGIHLCFDMFENSKSASDTW